MANRDSRGRNYPHSGFETSYEGFGGGRGRSEQEGHDEERWRRNQDWSPSQNSQQQSGYRAGSGQYGSESPYGYGSSGRSGYDYDEGRYGGGEGDFRSFQNREGSFGNSGSYGYGESGSTREFGGSSFGGYGAGEYNRREMNQNRYGNTGSMGGYGRTSYGQGSYGQGGGQQYREGQYGQGQQGGEYGSQSGYGSPTSGGYGSQGSFQGGEYGSQGGYGSSSGQYGQYGSQQGHRGRGPKGYTRSDQRIEEDVNERLSDDYYLDASNIEVSVQGGTVTLSGEAEDRDAKRRAEDLAESCSGVQQVQNNIRVKSGGLTGWLFGNGSEETENRGGTSSTQSGITGESTSKKASSSGS